MWRNIKMPGSRLIPKVGLIGLVFLTLTLRATAGVLPADALPLPNRMATAELVVLGKVTAIENNTVAVAPFPGAKNKVEYKIAVITVSEPLLAPKGTKVIRLGFVPLPPMVVVSPPPFQPTVGQEGCFFLSKHGTGDFQVVAGQLNFIDKKRADFAKDVALLKRCAKILADTDTALKAKSAEDRFLAAAMLVARYRTRSSPNAKLEPIEAEQSKRILEAIAGGDWTPTTDFTKLSPLMVLGRLPLTAKDGWMPPPLTDRKAYTAYARQWLREHAGKYRIQRWVAQKSN
jgi:hypothetical protein